MINTPNNPPSVPFFRELGWVQLRSFGLNFRAEYDRVPHLEPLLLYAAAPRMKPKVIPLAVSTEGGRAEILKLEGLMMELSLTAKTPLRTSKAIVPKGLELPSGQ